MAKPILSDIDSLTRDFRRIISRLEKARQMYDAERYDEGEELLDEACGTGERAMYSLRSLIGRYYYPDKDHSYITKRAAEEMEFKCAFTKAGYFHLSMPWLMPRKRHGSTSYLAAPLYYVLNEFQAAHPGYGIRQEKQVLMYVTVYGPEIPDARLVDVDNFETNFISDAVAVAFLKDDGPKFLGNYMSWGLRGKTTGAHVVLLSVEDFFKDAKNVISELSEQE